ncbi:hypothetical protein [Photobacterium marinum]|uniref:hypothetical protein n=1 Tax=Photobacterium marinum TaxID=1056511 RepID=UPI0012F89F1A|nr:hypothetical protein [Photobacterium marinum]
MASSAVEFKEYQLKQDKGYSDSLERMYLIRKAKPVKENNLDTFYIGKNYHAVDDQSLAVAAAGSINVFQLATHSILNSINNEYMNAGFNTKVYSDKEVAYIHTYDTTFVVPYDSNKLVPYCSTPDGYKSIQENGSLKN